MRKAFSLIELIMVIVIASILMTIAIASMFKEDRLAQAAEELVTNLRYTQHLALMDDVFESRSAILNAGASSHWERHRWRLGFDWTNNPLYGGPGWTYTVYRTKSGTGNNSPTLTGATDENPCSSIARDPLTKKCMSGGNDGTLRTDDPKALDILAITRNRDISSVQLGADAGVRLTGCGGAAGARHTIGFDEMGRPFSMTSDVTNNNLNYFRIQCRITLTDNNNRKMAVCIEPETGYVDYCKD